MRLLVVEDESLLRQQLEQGLQGRLCRGWRLKTASRGLYYATEFDYDAAIDYLGLPEIDGISLIQQIRSAGKAFPVLDIDRPR